MNARERIRGLLLVGALAIVATFSVAHGAETLSFAGTLPVAGGGTGATTTSQSFVFAGPSGSSGAPTFRALVSADLPNAGADPYVFFRQTFVAIKTDDGVFRLVPSGTAEKYTAEATPAGASISNATGNGTLFTRTYSLVVPAASGPISLAGTVRVSCPSGNSAVSSPVGGTYKITATLAKTGGGALVTANSPSRVYKASALGSTADNNVIELTLPTTTFAAADTLDLGLSYVQVTALTSGTLTPGISAAVPPAAFASSPTSANSNVFLEMDF